MGKILQPQMLLYTYELQKNTHTNHTHIYEYSLVYVK